MQCARAAKKGDRRYFNIFMLKQRGGSYHQAKSTGLTLIERTRHRHMIQDHLSVEALWSILLIMAQIGL